MIGVVNWDDLNFNPQKLIEALRNKVEIFRAGNFKCACCQHNVLNIGTIVELRSWNEGLLIQGSPVVPAISLVCDSCGHIQLHSAVKLGLINVQTGKIKV